MRVDQFRAPQRETVRDVPEAYIPSDRRIAIADGRELPDRTHGSALFADISGFTALTEALADELGGHRSSEELTAQLNRVFHAVIAGLDRFGGSVVYFSGDAITCWLDGDDGSRAVAAAFEMQRALDREGTITTPAGLVFRLAMKVTVAVGSARRFLVGDPEIQLIDALAGVLIDRLAEAEAHAGAGEVVLDESALAALGDRVEITETRGDPEAGRRYGVVGALRDEVPDSPLPPPARALDPAEVRPWLLPPVFERLQAGRGEFLAELRPAIPLFLRFGGIDFEEDDAGDRLDMFVRRVQGVLGTYGGNVLQLTIGDKGAYLYAIFGVPVAHEDDARRAAAAALELRLLPDGGVDGIQIGLTLGRLRSGTYGHELRRTYVCLGDAVNLAARLMSKAPFGAVITDAAARRSAGDDFEWVELAPVALKGKAEPVVAYRLEGARRRSGVFERHYELPMVGRDVELEQVLRAVRQAATGEGQVVGVTAEAGVGKSRLLAEVVRVARQSEINVLAGDCPAFGAKASYFVWRPMWRALLDAEGGVAAVERVLARIDESLVGRLPLLGPLLGLSIADNDLTRSFDAKLRKESLEALLADCLGALALDQPLMFVLEDTHWIDPLSRDLLAVLAREAARLPVAMLLAYRPAAPTDPPLGVERLANFTPVQLTGLSDTETQVLIRAKLEQLFGERVQASRGLVDLVSGRAGGNPFYVEELLAYIRDEGVDPTDDDALAALELPDSLHSLILSRIDTLDEDARRTLKVASVVGRVFRGPTVAGVYPDLGPVEVVLENLASVRAADLVTLDDEAAQAYLFNHVITQQVAYESIPSTVRADLHRRVGAHIESTEERLERHLDLLAHHYWLSNDEEKKRLYLGRAGDAAQADYANESAIDYFRRLVPLLGGEEQGPVLLKLGKVLELVGEWAEARGAYERALAHADELDDNRARPWAEVALAEVARKRGQYDEAEQGFRRAEEGFAATGDEAGTGLVLHLAGTLAAQRGEYDVARDRYERSLELRRRLDDKPSMGSLYSNLAIIAEYEADYDAARALSEQALAIRREAEDKWGVAVSENNLGNVARLQGDLAEARMRLEEALRLEREVGDRWMLANIQNNLANVAREQSDLATAGALYRDALRTYGDWADKWALAFLFEDIAALASSLGDAQRALTLAGAAETCREEIGTPRSPGDTEKLESLLIGARAALREELQLAALAGGRALALAQALAEAEAVCDLVPAGSPIGRSVEGLSTKV